MANLIHYRQRCIGCGICEELHAERWRMSKKDGKATLLHARQTKKDLFVLPLPEAERALAQEVARACPARVIKVG